MRETRDVRSATRDDLPRILELLAALPLGESPDAPPSDGDDTYERALEGVLADPRQTLFVIESDGEVVGTAVLIVVPNISHQGRPFAIVENVVVDPARRSGGHGEQLMRALIERAREAGCYKIALTSALPREDAHRFYERLGFVHKHKGFRLDFD